MITENIIVCIVMVATVFALSVTPLIIGWSRKRKAVKPAEFFPPDGASPVDVPIYYYGKGADPRNIFNPLMLYWAERGYVRIEEDCKRGLKLTKLNDLTSPDVGAFNAETFRLEKELFDYIFADGEVFYTLGASSDFAEFFEKTMSNCRQEAAKITDTKITKAFTVLTKVLPFALMFFTTLIVGLSVRNSEVVLMVFPFVAFGMSIAVDLAMPKGSSIRYFVHLFFLIFEVIPTVAMIAAVPWEASALLISTLLITALNLYVISKKIDIRTNEQLKIYGRICGFKNFLLLAEIRKLELLVEDDPEYFYKILPFCYTLKITEKLKPKFDRIVMDGPAWYLGELRETLIF